jgi:hypothetical protein
MRISENKELIYGMGYRVKWGRGSLCIEYSVMWLQKLQICWVDKEKDDYVG